MDDRAAEDNSQKSQHYFLIAGIVAYSLPNGKKDPVLGSIPTNAVVRHDRKEFQARKLGNAQMNLQKTFLMKMPDDVAPSIHDVIITNVSYLGEMTEEDFQELSPEMKEMVAREQAEAHAATIGKLPDVFAN